MPISTTPGQISQEKVVIPVVAPGNSLVDVVDSAVRYAVYLVNLAGEVLEAAETEPGTYTVHRVRAGVDTEIVVPTAASESAGVISATVDFSDGNWKAGDLGYIEFSGISATVVDATTELPAVRKSFRVIAEASAANLVVPGADATANAQMRDVVGNKADTAQTTVGTTRSLMAYMKGALNRLATLVGLHTVPAADATANAQMRDVVGNKADAAQTTVGTTRSLMGYIKGILGFHTVATADGNANAQVRDVVGNKEDAAVGTADNVSSMMAYIKHILAWVGGTLVYSSAMQAQVTVDTTPTNVSLPSVTVSNLPADLTIHRVYAAIRWRKQQNTALLTNAIDGNQQIQVRSEAPGTFRDAITMTDNALETAAQTETGPGMKLLGDSDISVEVVGEDTYEFQWTNALADTNSLVLHDVQTYLIIEYS